VSEEQRAKVTESEWDKLWAGVYLVQPNPHEYETSIPRELQRYEDAVKEYEHLRRVKAVGDRREQKLEALQDSKDKLAVEWSSVYDKLEAIKNKCYEICKDYGSEGCNEECDADGYGGENCYTRFILNIILDSKQGSDYRKKLEAIKWLRSHSARISFGVDIYPDRIRVKIGGYPHTEADTLEDSVKQLKLLGVEE